MFSETYNELQALDFEECNFEYLEEFCHGVAIWGHKEYDYYLTAKPYGSFTHFDLICADDKEEALKLSEYAVGFDVKSEEQIKLILTSL
jgi:hypothetical protein